MASASGKQPEDPPFSPSVVTFERQLFHSDRSALFLVNIQEKQYVLKLHRGRGPKLPYESRDRNTNPHSCEVTAYKRLQQHGLCSRGLVPKFYRSIEELNPTHYAPHLWMFEKDEHPPKGIILEYIPRMTRIYYTNYTETRMNNLMHIFKEIQSAGVGHNDIHPRNLMVFEDEIDPKRERAMWVDFDSAQTYDPDNLTERQREYMDFNVEFMEEIADLVKADAEEGNLNKSAMLYY
ncbi:hypothetical protein BJX99DRAFT_86909 [Aspergillus californicus]